MTGIVAYILARKYTDSKTGGGSGSRKKFDFTGDGTQTTFTCAHNFGSKDIVVIIYDENYNQQQVDVQNTDTNTTVVTYATAPASGEKFTVVCFNSLQGPKGDKGDPGAHSVSVSPTGTSTNEVNYITIDGVESKLAGGSDVSVSPTGTSTNLVKYITIDGTESKMGMDINVSATGTSTNDVRYITIDGTESRFASVALREMKEEWKGTSSAATNITTATAASRILADTSVIAGDGFLGTVKWKDLPQSLGQAEVKAFVLKKDSQQQIVQFECTSSSASPYAWFYNSYAGTWQTYVPLNDTVTSTSTTSALTANMGKNLQDQITNLQNIGRFLSIWDASTGLPTTSPAVLPYTYRTGDYYRVGAISTGSAKYHVITLTGTTFYGLDYNASFIIINNIDAAYTNFSDVRSALYDAYGSEKALADGTAMAGSPGTSYTIRYVAYSSDEEGALEFFKEDESSITIATQGTVVDTVYSGSINFKPSGTTYTGARSFEVETDELEIGAVYYYDGTEWKMQAAGAGGKVQDVQINGNTIVAADTGIANIPNSSSTVSGVMTSTQYNKLDGIAEGAQVNVLEGVKVNGTELTITDKKVNIPASTGVNSFGVMALANNSGLEVYNYAGYLHLANARNAAITARKPQMQDGFGPITTNNFDFAVKAALTDGVGTTYTDSEKTAARTRIGAGSPYTVTVEI